MLYLPVVEGWYQTNQKVPVGTYTCMQCEDNTPEYVYISKDDSPLPACSKCKEPTYWYK